MATARPLFLVGFMGAGKSHVGAALARALGRPHIDIDRVIEEDSGLTIARWFAERGESAFREKEWQLLQRRHAGDEIVSTGGGLFASFRARNWMQQHGCTLWLDAPLEMIRARVDPADPRPRWPAQPTDQRVLYDRRRAVYALARYRVEASGAVDDVVREIRLRLSAVFR